MYTACSGNLGTGNIYGGFSYGKTPTIPMSTAKRMKYKGEPSGPRLNSEATDCCHRIHDWDEARYT